MPRVSTAFRIPYHLVEPRDLQWVLADEATRGLFRREVVRLALAEKDRELAAGKDRHGLRLKPITRWTREHRKSAMGDADPNAPPLTPAYEASRTRAFLDGRAMTDHAEFFWRSGWGKILHYHRVGAKNRWARSGRLPVRDVIGMSPASLGRIRAGVLLWWRGQLAPPEEEEPEPERPTLRVSRRRRAPVPFQVELPAARGVLRPTIVATGKTDFRYATFGIAGGRARAERAAAAGTTTGGRQPKTVAELMRAIGK